MLAVHLDNLLFILLVAGIGLVRLLVKKAGGTTTDDSDSPPGEQTPPPLPRQTEQTDEERIRKFLEALGQPTSSKPPPPVRPRPVVPAVTNFQRQQVEQAAQAARRRKLLNPLRPLTTTPQPEPPRRVTMPWPTAPSYEVTPAAPPAATPPPLPATMIPMETYAVAVAASGPAVAATAADLTKLFRSRDDLRRAIILREVFGPPRGLQPLELIGSA